MKQANFPSPFRINPWITWMNSFYTQQQPPLQSVLAWWQNVYANESYTAFSRFWRYNEWMNNAGYDFFSVAQNEGLEIKRQEEQQQETVIYWLYAIKLAEMTFMLTPVAVQSYFIAMNEYLNKQQETDSRTFYEVLAVVCDKEFATLFMKRDFIRLQNEILDLHNRILQQAGRNADYLQTLFPALYGNTSKLMQKKNLEERIKALERDVAEL